MLPGFANFIVRDGNTIYPQAQDGVDGGQSSFLSFTFLLESAGFSSISSAENIQSIKVLSLGDEFRKVMAVGVSQEKFRKGIA